MAEIRKFMFDESFDDPRDRSPSQVARQAAADKAAAIEKANEPPPPPPPPTFSEEELAQAETEAFAAGQAQGLQEAAETIEQLTATTLLSIADALSRITVHVTRTNDDTARGAVALAVAIAAKMMPDLARRYGFDEIVTLVKRCLPEVIEQPRLAINVNEEVVEPLRNKLTTIVDSLGFAGRLVVIGDNNLGLSDCHIEWGAGGADRNTAELWRGIEDIIARNADLRRPQQPDTAASS